MHGVPSRIERRIVVIPRDKREFDVFFDWSMGKWFDGSAPLGPEIVTADEISDPHNLWIRLWLNGELMQDSNTSHMIFRIPETIAAISSVLTLEPGDVVAMGTPAGVGFARKRALRAGDHLRAEIEGLGAGHIHRRGIIEVNPGVVLRRECS